MPECSIVIINYNTFSLTVNCIRSIYHHVKGCAFEIVLVDNASVECDPAEFQRLFPDIVLIRNSTNVGFSGGNNAGVAHAQGEFILLLNSDTELLNDAVTFGAEALKTDSSIGVVSGQLLYPDGTIQPVAGVFPSIKRVVKELFRLTRMYRGEVRNRYYLGDLWNYSKPVEADWVWGAFFMFRKSDLRFFPDQKLHDTFFMYYEDVQWCYYFRHNLGKKVVYSPKPMVIHFLGKSDTRHSGIEQRYLTRILPNEYRWMVLTKGWVYAKVYYLLNAFYYFSLRRKKDVAKANIFLKFVFS